MGGIWKFVILEKIHWAKVVLMTVFFLNLLVYLMVSLIRWTLYFKNSAFSSLKEVLWSNSPWATGKVGWRWINAGFSFISYKHTNTELIIPTRKYAHSIVLSGISPLNWGSRIFKDLPLESLQHAAVNKKKQDMKTEKSQIPFFFLIKVEHLAF